MAEFCVECWNEINESDDPEKMFILSKELDICEECGRWKPVIIRVKLTYVLREWFREIKNQKKDLP